MKPSKDLKQFESFTMAEFAAGRGEGRLEPDFPVRNLPAEDISENPLGKLLEIISTLPEVRLEKVARARRIITQSDEELDCRMGLALDRVLEELLMEE